MHIPMYVVCMYVVCMYVCMYVCVLFVAPHVVHVYQKFKPRCYELCCYEFISCYCVQMLKQWLLKLDFLPISSQKRRDLYEVTPVTDIEMK